MNKLNQVLALAGVVAALALSADQLQAQAGGGGGGGGGGGRGGGGRGGGGGFDPAQMADRFKDTLEIKSDDEWNAVRPLIEKVMTARMDTMSFTGRGGAPGGPPGGAPGGAPGANQGRQRTGGGGRMGGTPSPSATALQTAIDSGSSDQIKSAMEKYRAARKDAEAKVVAAQDELKKVLNVKQEAIALRAGLVN